MNREKKFQEQEEQRKKEERRQRVQNRQAEGTNSTQRDEAEAQEQDREGSNERGEGEHGGSVSYQEGVYKDSEMAVGTNDERENQALTECDPHEGDHNNHEQQAQDGVQNLDKEATEDGGPSVDEHDAPSARVSHHELVAGEQDDGEKQAQSPHADSEGGHPGIAHQGGVTGEVGGDSVHG